MRVRLRCIAFLSFAALLLAAPLVAQEARGTIQGTVTDPQGAVIPGATVVVTNTDTGTARTALSSEIGYYEAPFLDAGTYSVSVELSGFKKTTRPGVVLNAGMKVVVNIKMEVGLADQTVTVTEAAPLLETTSASAGRVIDTKMIESLPFSDLNPFALTGMASGMQWTGQPEYRRPFDNGGTSSFTTSGGVGQNEYMIDGAPVTGTGRRVGFVPPADAVQEFNLQTAAFDASVGHTSGALVNVVSRGGTNSFHGALYDQHWQQRWNATPHFTRLAYEDGIKSGKIKPGTEKQGTGRSNQFGGTVGGPVRIPWLYNGKDKLFFFFSYNGIYQSKAETTDSVNRSVPKMNWRQGDFSDLLAIDPAKYQIYDPRTARSEGGRVVRDPFPGNKGIPILNPMYNYYVKLYPTPNDVPGLVSAEGQNNYLAVAMPKNERFNSILNRYDWNLSSRMRIMGKWYWNHRLADEYDWMYETARGLMRNGLTRINKGGGGDYTWTINNTNVFQASVNWTRFNEGSDRPEIQNYSATSVGLPKYIDDKAGDQHILPRLDFDSLEDAGQALEGISTRGTTAEAKFSMNTIWGKHSLNYGYVERRYYRASSGPGSTTGIYQYRNTYMRKNDADTVASHRGLEWAAFMMGVSNSLSIDTNDSGYWQTPFSALYLQDNFRVSKKLTLNLGLRWEREGGITERYNRGIETGFQYDAKLPITDAAQIAYGAIYAANPTLGLIDPAQFKVLGGLPYLGQYNDTLSDGSKKLLPRVGFAYQLDEKTVIRGGFGVYYDTINVNNFVPSQSGFSQPTSVSVSTDNGLTFLGAYPGAGFPAASLTAAKNIMTDPFPVRADGSRFDVPYGNKLGLMSRVGQNWDSGDYSYWRGVQPAMQERWRLGLQRQLRSDIVVEAAYNGALSKIPVRQMIDYLPQQYWATGNARVQAVDDSMNTNVSNPFNIKYFSALQTSDPLVYKYMSTLSFFTSNTIRKHQLLRPFPQFGTNFTGLRPGVDGQKVRGAVNYGDVELRGEKRFSKGFSTSFSYSWVFKSTVADFYFNQFDTKPSSRPNNQTRPWRYVWDTVYQFPFGKGHRWAAEGWKSQVAGGWEFGFIWQKQAGQTLSWDNRFYYGNLGEIEQAFNHDATWSKNVHQWFDPSMPFEKVSGKQPGSYHVRVFPSRIDSLRGPGIDNWDIKFTKRFPMREQMSTVFSVDLLNAFNHTNFSDPNIDPTSTNFGKLTSQRGLSRVIQFNLRFVF
jgi:hypothetical protein